MNWEKVLKEKLQEKGLNKESDFVDNINNILEDIEESIKDLFQIQIPIDSSIPAFIDNKESLKRDVLLIEKFSTLTTQLEAIGVLVLSTRLGVNVNVIHERSINKFELLKEYVLSESDDLVKDRWIQLFSSFSDIKSIEESRIEFSEVEKEIYLKNGKKLQ